MSKIFLQDCAHQGRQPVIFAAKLFLHSSRHLQTTACFLQKFCDPYTCPLCSRHSCSNLSPGHQVLSLSLIISILHLWKQTATVFRRDRYYRLIRRYLLKIFKVRLNQISIVSKLHSLLVGVQQGSHFQAWQSMDELWPTKQRINWRDFELVKKWMLPDKYDILTGQGELLGRANNHLYTWKVDHKSLFPFSLSLFEC